MEIIKSGRNREKRTHDIECDCGCEFRCTAYDGRLVFDRREGNYYVVACPECHAQHCIDVSLL